MKKYIRPVIIVILLLTLDRWSKMWILSHLTGREMTVLTFLKFTYAENTGVAFGMLQNNNTVLLILTVAILCYLVLFRRQFLTKHPASGWGFWFVISGALGNIWDRCTIGFVVDFINLSFFPAIFNVADSAITVGACLLGWGLLADPADKKQPGKTWADKKTNSREKESGHKADSENAKLGEDKK